MPLIVSEDPNILSWCTLEVDVTEYGVLNVNYKNQPLVENFESGFLPSPGRLCSWGARVAPMRYIMLIITLKTEVADEPIVTRLLGSADGFSVTFRDGESASVHKQSVFLSTV